MKISKVKVCIWNQRNEGFDRVGYLYENTAVRNISHFVSNSNNGARFLKSEFGIPDVSIVNNGIMPIRCVSEELFVDSSVFRACMVANITPKKDHITVLNAWKIVVDSLKERNVQAVLNLIGKEYDNGLVRGYVDALGLGNNVKLTGYLDNVERELCLADIAVFSSKSEGQPNGVAECMSAGLAVCASDIQAIRELVSEENVTYLSTFGDAEMMAHNILCLARDKELRKFIGRKNKERIENNYSPEQMCSEMTKIIVDNLNSVLPGR